MSEMERLIGEIESEVHQTRHLTGRRELAPRVMAAMRAVPRHLFVPALLREQAYVNAPLPLQDGQTISQPYIVALMTDLLEPEAGDRVLEIGTGSGYQAAVLARLVDQVYSLEINPDLSAQAIGHLRRLGHANVHCRVADGYAGWREQAPFDGIIVTAAAPHLPEALLTQLKPGARLVIPLGPPAGRQVLYVVSVDEQGRPSRRRVLDVAFVPMVPGDAAAPGNGD